ncbi:MAG: ABC transporter substrate-binding protein [Trueperaceae bacterium]
MKDFYRRVSILGLMLLAALVAMSAAAITYPLTITDDLGREVVLDEAPERVISMIPSSTETVCALDACELLVGVDQFSNFPAQVEGLPRLGSAFSPNIEELVALAPDLVLADEDSGIVSTLEQLGITVYAGTGQTFDEVFESFEALGLLLDRETEAALLSGRVRGEVEAVAEQASRYPSPTVFFELDATPYSVGPGSYIDELIRLAGGENIVGEGFGQFPQVDPEFVVAEDPQVIVLADAPFGETAESVAARPGWSSLSAVADDRIAELTSEQADTLSRPGPRMSQAVRLLATIFHPGRF